VKRLRALFHPIAIFVVAQVSWGLLMFVWIRWYVLRSREVDEVMRNVPWMEHSQSVSTLILVEGCVLMAIILVGLYLIFVSFRRQVSMNQLQSGFLDSVTHELKTPLAAIRLNTETLLMRELDEAKRRQFLARSMVEIERLQSLIDGVLLSARVESGFRVEYQYVDLLEILDESWRRISDRVGERRRLQFDRECGEEPYLWRMSLDYASLSMAFDNLLNNAVKYTDDGGLIAVVVRVSRDRLSIAIRDDGCGIEKRDLRRVFRKFYRSDQQRRKHVSGTGLGLYVSDMVIRAHKGRVYAASEGLNRGATFHVEFRRNDSTR
jgi:signal transduction histidine kinase